MSRRFLQILGGYICGSWGVVQALDWAVGHYLLSKSLVDFSVDLALLMLPAALLLAWFYGRDAHQSLHKRVVGVGVPLNVIVAAAVLFIVFHGKRLGATTEVVAVQDDNGATVERRIPKNEFRKRVLVFPFTADDPSAKDAWLRHAIPNLLAEDVRQDPFVDARDTSYVRDLFHKAHLGLDDAIPLAFARQAADSRHYDFFALGQLRKEGAQYRVRVALHSAASGHEVAHADAAGGDVCALVDELSIALRRDLGVPAPHIESAPDLPVCDIVTHSLPALAEATAADHAMFADDPTAALGHFEKAVQIDPTFADAEVTLFYFYFQSHQPDKMRQAMQGTLANLYKLSEPVRFNFTSLRYLLEGNYEKAGAVLTNWVTLYPQSAEAKQKLGEHYQRRGDRAQAAALFQQAIDLDLTSLSLYNELVELHMERGEVEPAVAVYRRFLAQFPNDGDVNVALADNLVAAARFAEAKEAYERALAIDDDNIHATLGLLTIRFLQGDRDASLQALKKLLAETKLPRDRRAVFDTLVDVYAQRGQMKLSLQTFLDERQELDRTSLPLNNDRARLESARLFVLAGRQADIEQLMARNAGSPTMKENVNLQLSMELAQLEIDDQLDDGHALAQHLPALETTLREFGLEHFRRLKLPYDARIKELAHDWAGAKVTWQALVESDWSSWRAAVGVGRCQRQLGDLAAAHAQLTTAAARFVGQAEVFYELALTDRTRDERAARAALTTALAIWAPADADFKPAQEARALAATLGATQSAAK